MRPFEIQGEQWGRAASVWANEIEVQMQPLYESTIDALGPLDGQRLLDAGCGTGETAMQIFRELEDVELHACDLTPASVEKARKLVGE